MVAKLKWLGKSSFGWENPLLVGKIPYAHPPHPPSKFTFGSAQKRKRKEDLVDVVDLVEEVWLTKNDDG